VVLARLHGDGGIDAQDTPIPTADVSGHTVAITPRAHAVAVPLANGQISIVGGGDPTHLIELVTPPESDLRQDS
jgi:hypothetical protein